MRNTDRRSFIKTAAMAGLGLGFLNSASGLYRTEAGDNGKK